MPHLFNAPDILAEWRAVERALKSADAGTSQAEALQADAMRLRNAYQRMVESAWEHNEPALPALEPVEAEVT